jgi:hypothetical protein
MEGHRRRRRRALTAPELPAAIRRYRPHHEDTVRPWMMGRCWSARRVCRTPRTAP